MVKQLLTLSAGEGAARGLHALAFLLLARNVGPVELGAFGLAQSVAMYGVSAVQRGLDVPAMLRVVRDPERAEALQGAILRLRVPVFLVLVAAAALWGNPLLLAMTGMLAAAALQTRWLLVSTGRSVAVAGGTLVSAAFFACGAALRLPLIWMGAALSAGELASAGIAWAAAGQQPCRADGLTDELRRESWPYLGSLLLGNLLYSLDVFVLGAIGRGGDVGLYLAGYRLITVFSPLLGALQSSSLPLFGKLYPDGAAAGKLAFQVAGRSTGVAVCVAGGLAATAGLLLPLLYGNAYGDAVPLVPLFALALTMQVPRMVYRQALLSFRGEQADLRNLGIAVAVNAGLDLLLAPRFGAMGCAVATFCTEVCLLLLTIRSCRRLGCA